MKAGSDHEGDGGWPYRDVKSEQKEIQRIRRIVTSEGQQVIDEVERVHTNPTRSEQ